MHNRVVLLAFESERSQSVLLSLSSKYRYKGKQTGIILSVTKLLPVRMYVPHASPVVGLHGEVVERLHAQVDSTPVTHNGVHYPLKENEQGQSDAKVRH